MTHIFLILRAPKNKFSDTSSARMVTFLFSILRFFKIDANSFVLNWDSMDVEFDHIFHYGGHLMDTEISGDKMKLFLEQHSKDFDIISSACNKKIQSYTDQ